MMSMRMLMNDENDKKDEDQKEVSYAQAWRARRITAAPLCSALFEEQMKERHLREALQRGVNPLQITTTVWGVNPPS